MVETPVRERLPDPLEAVAGTPGRMRIYRAGRMTLARVEGPLDQENGSAFLERVSLAACNSRRLVIDLRRTDYIDSAGVRALVALEEELRSRSGELRLVVTPESRVERTLALLKIRERFHVYETAAAACLKRRSARRHNQTLP